MAMYKVRITVYKGPTGKTLKGPTFVHFLGDICLGIGVFGVLLAIIAVLDLEKYGAMTGAMVIINGIVMAIVGFGLMAVLHKKAKKKAEAAFLSALEQQEKQTAAKKSN